MNKKVTSSDFLACNELYDTDFGHGILTLSPSLIELGQCRPSSVLVQFEAGILSLKLEFLLQ